MEDVFWRKEGGGREKKLGAGEQWGRLSRLRLGDWTYIHGPREGVYDLVGSKIRVDEYLGAVLDGLLASGEGR